MKKQPVVKIINYKKYFMTNRQKIFYLTYVPIGVLFAIWCSMVASCGIIPKEQPHPTKREIKREKRLAKKAIAKMERTDEKYKAKSEADTAGPHFCNTNYPPRIGKGSIRIIPGDTVTLTDTFTTVAHDTTTNVETVTKTVVKWYYVHDTAVVRDTIENTNRITLQSAEINGLRADNTKAWDEASKAKIAKGKWVKWTFIGWGLFALLIAVLIYANVKGWRK
jgi:hypothetical protein